MVPVTLTMRGAAVATEVKEETAARIADTRRGSTRIGMKAPRILWI